MSAECNDICKLIETKMLSDSRDSDDKFNFEYFHKREQCAYENFRNDYRILVELNYFVAMKLRHLLSQNRSQHEMLLNERLNDSQHELWIPHDFLESQSTA